MLIDSLLGVKTVKLYQPFSFKLLQDPAEVLQLL